ncbi:hypothetical protein AAFF_G00354730, partial [Aldrovandia affinis]
MSVEESYILSNIKEEDEEGWERQNEEMKREDGVRDEEVKGRWMEQEKERDEQRIRDGTYQTPETSIGLKNVGQLHCVKQEAEDLSPYVTSCLVKQPGVLNHQIEITEIGVPLSPDQPVDSNRDQEVISPWKCDVILPVKEERTLWHKGKAMTQKMIGILKSPLPDSSQKRMFSEPSRGCPVTSTKGNTGEEISNCLLYTYVTGVIQ